MCAGSPKSSKIGFTENPLASVQISLGILWISGQHQRGTGIGLIPYIWRRRCVRLRVSPRAEKRGGVPVIGTLQVARTCINPDLPWAIPVGAPCRAPATSHSVAGAIEGETSWSGVCAWPACPNVAAMGTLLL